MNELKEIKAPLLNDSGYGANIHEMIQAINDNFKILSNHDFIKGDKGNSLITKTVDLKSNTTILNMLKSAVTNQYFNNPIKPKNINGTNILKWFDNPGDITLIYEIIDGEEVLASSMPYVFKDLRFEQIYKSINVNEYDEETDYSCVIYYNGSSFIAIQEFPTLYYDSSNNCFSWKINGVNTGLEAMGPRGFAGKDGVFKIVKVAAMPDKDLQYKIEYILHGNNFINVNEGVIYATDEKGNPIFDSNGNYIELSNQIEVCKYYGIIPGISVMVLMENNTTYISEVFEDEGLDSTETKLYVHCSADNRICEIETMSYNDIKGLCEKYLKPNNSSSVES